MLVVAFGLIILATAVFVVRTGKGEQEEDPWNAPPVPPLWGAALVVGIAGAFTLLHGVSVVFWNSGESEPLGLFNGVSGWPIQYWRILAFCLSVFFFFYATRAIRLHHRRLAVRYDLPDDPDWQTKKSDREDLNTTYMYWRQYRRWGSGKWRTVFTVAGVAVFAMFVSGLFLIFGEPPALFRGGAFRNLHEAILYVSGAMVAAVTVYVLVTMMISWRHIVALAPEKSGWPDRVFNAYRQRLGVPKGIVEPVNQVLDLEVIAETTRNTGGLLRWPFLLLFFMILSRNTFHERLGMSPALLYSYGTLFSIALMTAVGLRVSASRARDHVLSNVRTWKCGRLDAADEAAAAKSMQAGGPDVPGDQSEDPCAWIDRVSDHVAGMDKGAFAPWYRHPIIQSVLLPLSGVALIAVTELISRSAR